jgi:hypothetical protein
MQAKPRNVHIFNRLGRVQSDQKHPKPLSVMGLDTRYNSGFKELSQPLVPE